MNKDPLTENIERVFSNIRPLTPEEAAQREAEWRQEEEEETRRAQVNYWFMAGGIPPRHRDAIQINRDGPWGAAEAKLLAKLDTGAEMALVGKCGPGKTQLGVEILRAGAERVYRVRYATATEFFLDLTASFKHRHETERDVIDEYFEPRVLVLDEMDKRAEKEWHQRLLFELADRRYRNVVKYTLLIANQEKAEFIDSIGPSLASRMRETGGIIVCDWPSFR
jgi:DNA replication protein DnaC